MAPTLAALSVPSTVKIEEFEIDLIIAFVDVLTAKNRNLAAKDRNNVVWFRR